MTPPGGEWSLRLSHAATEDFRVIIAWTAERFGDRQARTYAAALSDALQELTAEPDAPGARGRDALGPGIRLFHMAQRGRRGRHVLVFRVREDEPRMIEVIRILHDAMDARRHVPVPKDDEA